MSGTSPDPAADPPASDRAAGEPTTPMPAARDGSAAAHDAGASARNRVTGVIVVGMSVAVWWPAFTIGAWGEPFFDQMLTVWAAATGALIVVLVHRDGTHRIRRALALAAPSVWLAVSFVVDDDDADILTFAVAALALLVALLAVPTTIWVLARMIWPEFGEDIFWPRRFVVLGAVAVIALASFLLGANQSRFLTCDDFSISGNSLPPGCTAAPTEAPE